MADPTQAVKTGYGPREAVTLLNDWQYTNRDIAEKHRAHLVRRLRRNRRSRSTHGGYGGYSTKEHKSYGQTCGDDRDDGQRGGDRGGWRATGDPVRFALAHGRGRLQLRLPRAVPEISVPLGRVLLRKPFSLTCRVGRAE